MNQNTNNWIKKVWGQTRLVIESPRFQRHELQTEAGGYCSWHYHDDRENLFVVESGMIAVLQLFGWKYTRRVLGVGESMFVPAKVVHQFQVIESGRVVEEYWPAEHRGTISLGDIERLTIGGMLDSHETFDSLMADGYPQLEELC